MPRVRTKAFKVEPSKSRRELAVPVGALARLMVAMARRRNDHDRRRDANGMRLSVPVPIRGSCRHDYTARQRCSTGGKTDRDQ